MHVGTHGRPVSVVLILGTILLLAAVLRIIGVNSQGIWTDEGLTLTIATRPLSELFLVQTDPTPGLYYVLHRLLVPADPTLFELRSISIVAGIAAIAVMYVAGRVAFGREAGLWAALLLAVWPVHVDYSQEARAYSLLLLFTLTASTGTILYARAKSGRDATLGLILFAAGSVLSFYTHVIGALWIATTGIIVLCAWFARRPSSFASLLVAGAMMLILAMPKLYWLFGSGPVGASFNWLIQPGPLGFASVTSDVLTPLGLWAGLTGSMAIEAAMLLAFAIFLAIGSFVARHGVLAEARKEPFTVAVVVAYLAFAPALWLAG